MSWVEQIKNDLIITTGDGAIYFPSWINARFGKEYNNTVFEYPKLAGSFVDRKQPMGRTFTLELYFTGPDHLDTMLAFNKSADDLRPWKLQHPYYGLLFVQPLGLDVDNSAHNVSKITIPVIETLLDDAPRVVDAPVESIAIKKELIDETFTQSLKAVVQPADITSVKINNKRLFSRAAPIIKIPEQYTEYTNFFNKADAGINKATALPIQAMQLLIGFISYPARLSQSVDSRVSMLKDQFQVLRNNLSGFTKVSSKQLYQIQAGSIISSMALAMSTPFPGDYRSSTATLDTMDSLSEIYGIYLGDLDLLQSLNGGSPDSFIPDADSLIALDSLVFLTISNLFNIALAAKKERSIITEHDTNWIVLTHRLYGLDPLDQNIAELMENNNVGLNGLLIVKKGTKIIYYL